MLLFISIRLTTEFSLFFFGDYLSSKQSHNTILCWNVLSTWYWAVVMILVKQISTMYSLRNSIINQPWNNHIFGSVFLSIVNCFKYASSPLAMPFNPHFIVTFVWPCMTEQTLLPYVSHVICCCFLQFWTPLEFSPRLSQVFQKLNSLSILRYLNPQMLQLLVLLPRGSPLFENLVNRVHFPQRSWVCLQV